MTDLHFGSWFGLTLLFVALILLAKRPSFARGITGWLIKRGAEAVERARPVPEFDQVADDLFRVFQREKLRADIARLQRILATDETMSATRQLGNRIAYNWLLREQQRICDPWEPEGAISSWSAYAPLPEPVDVVSGQGSQRAPKVEILEIGWRR